MIPFLQELKLQGISPQLDLGNFTVGAATMLVALVSLFIAFRSTRNLNNHKIAEFRQAWIDDLRQHVSEFVGVTYELLNHALSAASGQDRQRDLDTKHSELKRIESYVAMKLNSHERDHRVLIQLISQIRGRIAAFSVVGGSRLVEEAETLLDLLTEYSKLIYKYQWDRVRDDSYGRGRINRYVRNYLRKRNRKQREAIVRDQASVFFNKISVSI